MNKMRVVDSGMNKPLPSPSPSRDAGHRRTRATGNETRALILDMAERICAEGGFEALSIRAISDAARVNVAAITYHFGGKAQLFEEMFRRRVVPLNERRLAMLDRVFSAPNPQLEDVVRAFVEPPMSLMDPAAQEIGNPARVVMQFLSRAFAMPGEGQFLETYYEPVRSRFILALKHLLPDLPLQQIIWRYNLMVGGIIYAMGGIERMERPPAAFSTAQLPEPADLEAVVREMVLAFSASFRAPASAL